MNNIIYYFPEFLISILPAVVFGILGGLIGFFISFIITFLFCIVNDKFQII